MKRFGAIIIVLLLLFLGVVGVAVVYILTQQREVRQAESQYQQYVTKYAQQNPQDKSKAAGATPTPVPTIAANSLDSELQAVTDDGGKSDFDQLQAGINAL